MYIHCLYTVPSPVVKVTSIGTVEFGKPATLECNAITVKGITSRVSINWLTGFNSTVVRRVENVTANIVNNSAFYTDQLVTAPLSTNDNGRVYYCEISINSTLAVRSYDNFLLDFKGR